MPNRSDAPDLLARLATLGDMARLRMLRLLEREELSVGELAKALQLPQSTVSRHLKLLHASGWAAKRTEGPASLYRLDAGTLDAGARELWKVAAAQIGAGPTFEEDDSRLTEVLASRRTDSRAFFGRIGGEWDELRRSLFGEDFTAQALLSLLDESWVVADIGCGTGNAVELLASHVKKVIAIDREPAMLDAARKRLKTSQPVNTSTHHQVEFRQGDLAALPLKDQEIDAAVVMLVMHHVPEPAAAVKEIARALKPGGALLIIDMTKHDRDTYRHTMGHLHLGFSQEEVARWAQAALLGHPRYVRLRPAPSGKGPGLFAASMRKPIVKT